MSAVAWKEGCRARYMAVYSQKWLIGVSLQADISLPQNESI